MTSSGLADQYLEPDEEPGKRSRAVRRRSDARGARDRGNRMQKSASAKPDSRGPLKAEVSAEVKSRSYGATSQLPGRPGHWEREPFTPASRWLCLPREQTDRSLAVAFQPFHATPLRFLSPSPPSSKLLQIRRSCRNSSDEGTDVSL